jgi:hypothetical protein
MPTDITVMDAYVSAKRILRENPPLDDGIGLILEEAHRLCPDPFWQECRQLDFYSDVERIQGWLRRAFTHPRNRPSSEVEILWLALLDVEEGFDLRGNSKWSKDSENWDWCAKDNYFFNEDDPPPRQGGCLSTVMERWTWGLMDYAETKPNLHHVGSWFATLAYAAVVGTHVFSTEPAEVVLGDRNERWFAVGHPDSEYGIILGRRTKTKWVPFEE